MFQTTNQDICGHLHQGQTSANGCASHRLRSSSKASWVSNTAASILQQGWDGTSWAVLVPLVQKLSIIMNHLVI